MKAIKRWGHDAYFDYIERWMSEDDPYRSGRGNHQRPRAETTTSDPFVTAMWRAHRKNAPEQEKAGNDMKWVWKGNQGVWIKNGR